MIDEREVPPTRGEDPRGLVAVAQIGELPQSVAIGRFRLCELPGCLRRPWCARSDSRTERNREQLTLLDPELSDHYLSSAGGIRTCLEREHAANCEQPEQPDPHDEESRPAGPVGTHSHRELVKCRRLTTMCKAGGTQGGCQLITHAQSLIDVQMHAIGASAQRFAVKYGLACPPAWRSRACLPSVGDVDGHTRRHVTCQPPDGSIGKPHTSVRACRPNSAIQVRHAVNGNLSRSTIERPQNLRVGIERKCKRPSGAPARHAHALLDEEVPVRGRRGRLADNGRKVPDELSIAIDAEPAARCLDKHAPVRGRPSRASLLDPSARPVGAPWEHDQQPGDAVPCHPTPEHGKRGLLTRDRLRGLDSPRSCRQDRRVRFDHDRE